MANKKLIKQVEELHEKLLPGVEMRFEWDCDECSTLCVDKNGKSLNACPNCGYTWKQKCERWP